MKIKEIWPLIIPILVITIALIFGVKGILDTEEPYLVGMIETSYTDIASEIPGRLKDVLVEDGDTVVAGQQLLLLRSHEIDAFTSQAEATLRAAEAHNSIVQSGPRKSTINSAKNFYLTTKESYALSKKNYQRGQSLYNDSVIAATELEALRFKAHAAQRQMQSARADYESVKSGARDETKISSQAGIDQAQGAVDLAHSLSDNISISAPVSGVVVSLIVTKGEVVNTGYPLMTIMDPHDFHAILHIRQDKMLPYQDGVTLKAYIPGVSKSKSDLYDFVITHSSSMLNFADWVPTNQKGNFDLKTFEVHLRPINTIDQLKPGMTIGFIPLKS